MSISISVHPKGFEAHADPARKYAWIDVDAGDSKVGIFLTAEQCDELIAAAAEAKHLIAAGEGEGK